MFTNGRDNVLCTYVIMFIGSSQEEGRKGGTRDSRVRGTEKRRARERTTGNSSSSREKSNSIFYSLFILKMNWDNQCMKDTL